MKRIFFLLFFFVSAFNSSAQKSDTTYYKNHFYINPLDLLFRSFEVTYERDVTQSHNSIAVTGGVLLQKTDYLMESGFNFELQYRINVFNYETSKRGFQSIIFFAPYFQFRYRDHESNQQYYTTIAPVDSSGKGIDMNYSYTQNSNLRGYGTGVVMGLKSSAFHNRFCFGFYGGGGIKYSDARGDKSVFGTSIVDDNYTGITPKFGFQVGVSF